MGAADVLRANVKALLHERHMSQADLTRALGISGPSVSSFLKGKHSLEMSRLDDLARALNTTVPYLFADRDLFGHGGVLELSEKGTLPNDPAALKTYLTHLHAATEAATRRLFDLAVAGAQQQAQAPSTEQSARPRRRGRPRRPRTR